MTDYEVTLAGEELSKALEALEPTKHQRFLRKLVLAALNSVPWVGGFLATMATLKEEEGQLRTDGIQRQWLEQHAQKLKHLQLVLEMTVSRLASFGDEIQERLESEEYLSLVRQAFRLWDQSATEEKQRLVQHLLTNAGASRICSDDVVRLFLDWIEIYHEAHFAVIREIYKHPSCTRYDIWMSIYGSLVRESSAEADLYKLLIRDLSTGGVIRQERQTTHAGEFLKKSTKGQRVESRTTMESAFEKTKPYVLTELGKQFVHYTMEELVPRIADTTG